MLGSKDKASVLPRQLSRVPVFGGSEQSGMSVWSQGCHTLALGPGQGKGKGEQGRGWGGVDGGRGVALSQTDIL